MRLLQFHAENFRNIACQSIRFSEGVNLLLGENAQGKTNVMEGIYFFSRGKSHRGSSDKEMTRFGAQGMRIGIDYEDSMGKNSLTYAFADGQRKRMKNGYKLDRVTDMVGSFRAVLFCPDHLGLVKAGPEERRRFLDIGISSCNSAYLKYYANYKSALEERSCLLKMMQKGLFAEPSELSAWSESLAEYSSYLYLMRRDYAARIAKHAAAFLHDMTDGGEIMRAELVTDITDDDGALTREQVRERYLRIYSEQTAREIAAGTTLFGPSRDELEIYLGDKRARHFASQGQQRSVVLALKSAEGEVCREITGEHPVYLFDDVLSELDAGRRAFVLSGMAGKQLILTSCNRHDGLCDTGNVIEVANGEYHASIDRENG